MAACHASVSCGSTDRRPFSLLSRSFVFPLVSSVASSSFAQLIRLTAIADVFERSAVPSGDLFCVCSDHFAPLGRVGTIWTTLTWTENSWYGLRESRPRDSAPSCRNTS
eukprot:150917-Prymnesium_polylepis.2